MVGGGGVLALLEAISRMPLTCLSPALGQVLGGVSSRLTLSPLTWFWIGARGRAIFGDKLLFFFFFFFFPKILC